MRARPAHGHRGVLRGPSTLEREVLDGRDIVEVPLQQRHVGRGGDQGVVVPAIRHRQWHLFRLRYDGFVVGVVGKLTVEQAEWRGGTTSTTL